MSYVEIKIPKLRMIKPEYCITKSKENTITAGAINQVMRNYATSIDPCGMCRHCDHTNTDICGQCCYYWGSMFDLDTKRQEKNKGVRHE